MLSAIMAREFRPAGCHAVYHDGEVNHCPGCGRAHWLVGRVTAECAFCSTAIPLKLDSRPNVATIIRHKNAR